MGFSSNLEGENVIEFQNVACYVLELLRIFDPNLEKRPETCLYIGHFVIQGKLEIPVFALQKSGLVPSSSPV